MTTADHDFEKFREKKLNEKAAEKHEDDAVFFGSVKKKEEPDKGGPKKIRLSDLNLPDKDARPGDVPKVGESLKLIDIALGNAPGAPPRPHAPQRPGQAPPRPATGQQPGAPRPGGSPPPRPSGTGPAQRPPAPAQRPTGQQPRPATGIQRPPAPRPLIPPQGAPAVRRPAAPPPGFQDHAHPQPVEKHEAPRDEQFEDTTFVEATDHADPYEFREQGGAEQGRPEFGDSADASARPRPPGGRPPAPQRPPSDPSRTASGRLKAVKPQPPAPQPKKTSSRRVKRGPLGR